MESPHLNPPLPPEDDPLEVWLRPAPPAPLADNGFSARVLQVLPTSARPVPAWRSFEWLIAALAIGVCLVVGFPFGPGPFDQPASRFGLQVDTWLTVLMAPKSLLALGLTLGILALLSFDEELPSELS
jgi:hypothetical protein